ncbi:MAG: amidohydrolase family protein [bacterium]|nr:amidohydrolase family protein [bacterium]
MRNHTTLAFGLSILLAAAALPAIAEEMEAPSQVLIENVNIWDGTSDGLTEGMSVLIEGNLIKEVSASASAGQGATVLDGGGRTLMPGLIDMHSHLATGEGLAEGRDDWDAYAIGAIAGRNLVTLLEQGFTTTRGAGGPELGLAKAVNKGRIPGPRYFPSGPWISQTAGHADLGYWTDPVGHKDYSELTETSHVVDGVPEVLRAARYNLRKGATQIKIMGGGGVSSEFDPLHVTQFTLEEMKAAVQAAEDWGTYVLVHAYHDRSINRAIDAGARTIEHGFLMSEETIKRMAAEGVALSLQGLVGIQTFANPEEITFFTDDQRAKARQVNEQGKQMIEWARKHNLLIISGGDTFGVDLLADNIENVIIEAELGFTPFEALKHATSNAAEVLSWSGGLNPFKEGPLGVVKKGAYADLLLIDGNPLEDLTVLRDQDNLVIIMKDGELYKNTL